MTKRAKTIIQSWINKKNSEQYVKPLYFTLREIHTTIKNYEPTQNSHSIFFKGNRRADKVPRFDKIIEQAKEQTRLNTVSASRQGPRAYNYNRYEQFENLEDLVKNSRLHKDYANIYDPKQFKLRALRG